MIRTLLFKLILALWFVGWAPILLVGLIDKCLNRFLVTKCAGGVLVIARLVAGIDYKIHYPPRVIDGVPVSNPEFGRADGKVIIAAKHMSILEVAVLETHIKNSFFIVKRELLWIPIYGWCFWRMGLQPVNRTKGATDMRKLSDAVADKILNGMTLIIFPEGTRASPGAHPKLKRGLMYLAENLKLPILPVGTDSGLYWPKRGRTKPGTANVWFEELLPATATLDEVHMAINKHSA